MNRRSFFKWLGLAGAAIPATKAAQAIAETLPTDALSAVPVQAPAVAPISSVYTLGSIYTVSYQFDSSLVDCHYVTCDTAVTLRPTIYFTSNYSTEA